MKKKVVILSTSPRKNSNSEALAGSVFGGGVTEVGEIQGSPALDKAYEMGKAI